MMRLLFDCGIFACVDKQKGIYYQMSGVPLSFLEPLNQDHLDIHLAKDAPVPIKERTQGKSASNNRNGILHKPNGIVFVRRRMLYARPTRNLRGDIMFGLAHTHVLNRFPSSDSLSQTVHVMKYIFPRQFGLNNVFTSKTGTRETTQSFKEYTFREEEIARSEQKRQHQNSQPMAHVEGGTPKPRESVKVPKRLRGTVKLIQKLQDRNKRCAYNELLRYYCPQRETDPWKIGSLGSQPGCSDTSRVPNSSASEQLVTQIRGPYRTISGNTPEPVVGSPDNKPTICQPKRSLTEYSTPPAFVSAFCRAVLQKLIPSEFYGTGEEGRSNRKIILKHVDEFVRMRQFESLSLHEVCKGLKVTCMPWLEPPKIREQASSSYPKRCKLSLSDLQKRTELLHEFVYYIFDSILIPLIRTNFYVTESQIHRNRLFYFRHDVWHLLTEKPLQDLQSSMFEDLKGDKAQRALARRSLGYGVLRLLPKPTGVRPILNLRRRMMQRTSAGKKSFLGPSVNSIVTPIANMLNYERVRKPAALGSALQSVGEMHFRLKSLKERLQRQQHGPKQGHQPLYFVKLDIQSCFDTIPQHKLIDLIERTVSEDSYYITKHVEVRPPIGFNTSWPPQLGNGRPVRKFVGRAAPVSKPQPLLDIIAENAASRKPHTVFVDALVQKEHTADELLDLLNEHVRNNMVKIGNKYLRQRNGIPQGSVLSSLLCNFFYGALEREVLGFLQTDRALLLRLVDDFLLITSDAELAMRFLQVMMKGQPAYGVSVNPSKSLVNFEATVNGIQVPRLVDSRLFPYCGNLIDTHTLEIHKDTERALEGGDSAGAALSDALTVESARVPGRSFHRKMLATFKLQMHPMYLDTSHNSTSVILANLYSSFITSAMKMYRYMKSLRGRAHPAAPVVIRTIRDLIHLTSTLIQTKRIGTSTKQPVTDSGVSPRLTYAVHHSQIVYLAAAAFRFVLGRKQTRYAEILRWLDVIWRTAKPRSDGEMVRLAQVVRNGNMTFGGWRF